MGDLGVLGFGIGGLFFSLNRLKGTSVQACPSTGVRTLVSGKGMCAGVIWPGVMRQEPRDIRRVSTFGTA